MSQEPKRPVANLYPPVYRDSLIWAARQRNIQSIDDITDQLVGLGLVRPRSELRNIPGPSVPVFARLAIGGAA